MIEERLSAPKADALPGCATPRTAVSLGNAAVNGKPMGAFHGSERQNGARTGNGTYGISPNPIIYHGTPMTPRAALQDVGKGRAFCVSFFHPQDVEVVQEISPAVMFRQRCVLGMESRHQARGPMVHPRGLDAVLPMVGAALVSSGALGGDSRCPRSTEPAQRFTASRMAVRSEGRAALAHGRAVRSAFAPVRAVRPGLLGMDRRGQDLGQPGVSRAHGGSCRSLGQPVAGSAHDARHGGCPPLPLYQRGQHKPCAERMAI